jgi:N-acetylglutamate synthase-like GNAT family acetyltransferase
VSGALQLRFAELSDAQAIARLINTAFQVERFFIDSDRITVVEVCEKLRSGEFILATGENALAGCVYVELRGERAYVGLLSVDPARQRSGLGAQLMQAVENHCRENGCAFVDLLIVNLREELPRFYRKLGYVESGTEPFPAGERTKLPCHFVRMTKPLADFQGPAADAISLAPM